jgi:sugar lactone lactonase YvrE
VTAVRGFDHPESVWYDSTLDVYFVSNTGNGNGDDSHGFISRLESDGAIDSLRFIADGQNGVTLHTPRGLAILGDTIWVADGKTLRGFDKNSGKSVGDVDFSQLDAELLNDVALGPDGSVFITDTRARDGDGEIFSIPQLTVEGRSRNPQRVSTNQSLQGPNGITWDRVRGHYLVASFLGNDIYSWMPGADPTTIVTGPGRFDGIAALGDGRVLVTSWNDSSLMLLRRDSLHSVISGLPEPADIGIDNKRQRVAIPLSATNEVVIFTIPPATAGRKVPTKVTR